MTLWMAALAAESVVFWLLIIYFEPYFDEKEKLETEKAYLEFNISKNPALRGLSKQSPIL